MTETTIGEHVVDTSMRSLTTVFKTYRERLVSRAQRTLGSYEDAQDVVQDVMVLLLEGPEIIPDVDNLIGWLFTVVRRRCIDLIRAGSRRRNREEKAISLKSIISSIDDPDVLVEQQDFIELIAGIISHLPPEQRDVLIDHEVHELSYREISQNRGVPMGTLMARKKRALDSVRRMLGDMSNPDIIIGRRLQ